MTKWRRRSVLATGATLTAGGVFASIGAGEESADNDDLPDPDHDPNPGVDEDWPSFGGGAGHARYVPEGTALDGDALTDVWSVDGAAGNAPAAVGGAVGGVAIADGVVYATPADDVLALDAADGSTIWENTEVDANAPSVVDDTVYVTGDELFALDVADGSIRWQTEFEPEDSIQSQTVAYDTVFVVVDGTLYALETADGSVRWELESVTVEPLGDGDEEEHDFLPTTAAANGVVYAGAGEEFQEGATLALDPETGDEVWRGRSDYDREPQARATTAAVTVGRVDFYARVLLDAQTGDNLRKVSADGVNVTLGEEIYVAGYNADALVGHSIDGDEYSWEVDAARNVRNAVIVGDTVYAYFHETQATYGEYNGELVALDKYDGSERWSVSIDDFPVGEVLAVSGDTLYANHDGDLVALRAEPDDGDDGDEGEDGEERDDGDENDEDPGDGDENEQDDGSEEDDDRDEQDEDGEDPDDDDQGELEDADEDDSEANDGDGESDVDDPADDERESEDDSDDEDDDQYGGEEGAEEEVESDDGVGDTDEDGDDEASDDDPNGDDGTESEDEPDTDDEDEGGDTDDGDDTDTEAADDEGDAVPGFTTGAGIAGGALGLEWLRRRAATDASAESTDERTVPGDEPEN